MPVSPISPEQLQQLETLYRNGRFDELAAQAAQLARSHPLSPLSWNILGSAHMAMRQFEAARTHFEKAIELRPNYPDALNNLGLALKDLDQPNEAISALTRALTFQPDRVETLSNLGSVYRDSGRHQEAESCLTRASTLDPNYAFAHQNLGVLYEDMGRREDAIRCFTRVLELDPANDRARALRLMERAHICAWDAMAEDMANIAAIGTKQAPIPPSLLINLDDSAERNFVRAQRYARGHYPSGPPSQAPAPSMRATRLRLGYFSADFHEHATMHLMARLFELHDRKRFEVHAFSYGPDTRDPMRARVRDAVDVFHDVRTSSDAQTADLAHQHAIDIAIDLKGDTTDTRLGIFACRAAPIQIAYLGFPGTVGASFLDYIVADEMVLPRQAQQYFSEKAIYLPHTYQVNDDTRQITEDCPTRAEAGLADDAFVFCCFNNSFKITPAEFDIWMRLLRQIDGSVLWLLRTNAWVEANLRSEAHRRGVDPSRLVFADRVPSALNLARQRLADLFLDTFACNAHTTASDALWAGLPVLTKPGNAFGARVAASLLKTIELPELIADSAEAYEALALALAREPARLAAIKTKLAANRLSAPLFNSALTTRHIEQAYDAVYQRYLDGKAPDVIDIPA